VILPQIKDTFVPFHCNLLVTLLAIHPSLGSNTSRALLPPQHHVSFFLNFILVFESGYMPPCLSIHSPTFASMLLLTPLTVVLQQSFPSLFLNSLSLSLSSCLLNSFVFMHITLHSQLLPKVEV
jgi:hypothetical protein